MKFFLLCDIITKARLRTFASKVSVTFNSIQLALAWDVDGNFDEYNCIDIDPETIYSTGIDVADPLSLDANVE